MYDGTVQSLVNLHLGSASVILLKTEGKDLSEKAARVLSGYRPTGIGIDYQAVGNRDVHNILQSANIGVLEDIDLTHAIAGKHYNLLVKPIKKPGRTATSASAHLSHPLS